MPRDETKPQDYGPRLREEEELLRLRSAHPGMAQSDWLSEAFPRAARDAAMFSSPVEALGAASPFPRTATGAILQEPSWRATARESYLESQQKILSELSRPIEPPGPEDELWEWRKQHDWPVIGTLINFAHGIYENISGLVSLAIMTAKGAYSAITSPVQSYEWITKPMGEGGALDLGAALLSGYWEGVKRQYGSGIPILHQLQYYPFETVLDIGALLGGIGAALKVAGKAGGAARALEAAAKAGRALTAREAKWVRLYQLGDRMMDAEWVAARSVWRGFQNAWHSVPALSAFQARTGIGPRSVPQDLALRELAAAERRYLLRAQSAVDDLVSTEGFEDVFGVSEKLRAMEKVRRKIELGEKVSPEDERILKELREKDLARFRAAHLGEGWSKLTPAEQAYIKHLKRLEMGIADLDLEMGNISLGAYHSVPLDLAVKFRSDGEALRRHLADKFGLDEGELRVRGFAKYRDHSRIEEISRETARWVADAEKAEVPLLYHHITIDPDSKFVHQLFDWNSKRVLSMSPLRRRSGLPPGFEDLAPDNFHDAWLRTHLTKIKLQEYAKALARLTDPKGEFMKHARPISKAEDLRAGEALMPGSVLLTLAYQQVESFEAMTKAMRTAAKKPGPGGSLITEKAMKEVVGDFLKTLVSDPSRMEKMQREMLVSLGNTMYAVPAETAYVMSKFLLPPNSPFLTAVDRFNSVLKIGLLSLNPLWYLQGVAGGALQSWLATGTVSAGPRLWLRLRRRMVGMPMEAQTPLYGLVDEAARVAIRDTPFERLLRYTAFPMGLRERAMRFANYIDDMMRGTTFAKIALHREVKELIKRGVLETGENMQRALDSFRVADSMLGAPRMVPVERELSALGWRGTIQAAREAVARGTDEGKALLEKVKTIENKRMAQDVADALQGKLRHPTQEEYYLWRLSKAREDRDKALLRLARFRAQQHKLKAEAARHPPEPPAPSPPRTGAAPTPPPGAPKPAGAARKPPSRYEQKRAEHTAAAIESKRAAEAIPGHKMLFIGGKVIVLPTDPAILGAAILRDPAKKAQWDRLREILAKTEIPREKPWPTMGSVEVLEEMRLERGGRGRIKAAKTTEEWIEGRELGERLVVTPEEAVLQKIALGQLGDEGVRRIIRQIQEGKLEISLTEMREAIKGSGAYSEATKKAMERAFRLARKRGIAPGEERPRSRIPTNEIPRFSKSFMRRIEEDIALGRPIDPVVYRKEVLRALLPEDVRGLLAREEKILEYRPRPVSLEDPEFWDWKLLEGPPPFKELPEWLRKGMKEEKWSAALMEYNMRTHELHAKFAGHLREKMRELLGKKLSKSPETTRRFMDALTRASPLAEAPRIGQTFGTGHMRRFLSRYLDILDILAERASGKARGDIAELGLEVKSLIKKQLKEGLVRIAEDFADKLTEIGGKVNKSRIASAVEREIPVAYGLKTPETARPTAAKGRAGKGRAARLEGAPEAPAKAARGAAEEPPGRRKRSGWVPLLSEEEYLRRVRQAARIPDPKAEMLDRLGTIWMNKEFHKAVDEFLFGAAKPAGAKAARPWSRKGGAAAAAKAGVPIEELDMPRSLIEQRLPELPAPRKGSPVPDERALVPAPLSPEEFELLTLRAAAPKPILDMFIEISRQAAAGNIDHARLFAAIEARRRALRGEMKALGGAKRSAADDVTRYERKAEREMTELERASSEIEAWSAVVEKTEPLAKAWDDAFRTMDDFHFNYFNLHPMHRLFLRNIFLFWSWYYHIGKMSVASVFRHPLRVKLLQDVGRLATLAMWDPSEPEWVRSHIPVGVFVDGLTGDRELLLMNVRSFDPRASIPTDEGGILSRMHPFIVAAVEWADGRDKLTRKPLRPGVVVDPATGVLMEFDPHEGLRPRPAFSVNDIPEVLLRLSRATPAGYAMDVLTRPWTKTERSMLDFGDEIEALGGISAAWLATSLDAAFRIRLTNSKALRAREQLEKDMWQRGRRWARQYLKEIRKRGPHPWGYELDREAVEHLLRRLYETDPWSRAIRSGEK